MAKTPNPGSFDHLLPEGQRKWIRSVHKTLLGSVDLGVTLGQHPLDGSINSGVFNQFDKGNGSGILIRIAATAGTGASYIWPVSGSLEIQHGLGRQPIGFHVVDSDKDVRVYRTAAPDKNQITFQPTDRTASVTLYIF